MQVAVVDQLQLVFEGDEIPALMELLASLDKILGKSGYKSDFTPSGREIGQYLCKTVKPAYEQRES